MSIFVLGDSKFDLISTRIYAIIAVEIVEDDSLFCRLTDPLTTYLTIDSSGAHGNNGYKTAKEDFLWGRNGYKKPFMADMT